METLKHECGVALIRLLKPLEYYAEKYGSWRYGLNKLYLMMEKQHNRGQEGAGVACVNLDAIPGNEYMFRERAEGKDAITEVFKHVDAKFAGQLYMGHLRYSTTGKSGLTHVHPFLRRNNWRAKNLCLCGNFNMTNIDEVFKQLIEQGQSPRLYSDSYIMLELMGHRLDREVERLYAAAKEKGLEGTAITRHIDEHVDMGNVLRSTLPHFDGGYVMCGLTGSGEMFAVRDPWGIRPAYYYHDDEVAVVASERPVIQTTFNLPQSCVKMLEPGQALIVSKNGDLKTEQILETKPYSACSFERIYFSRGSDSDIYKERKLLGEQLTKPIMEAIGGDISGSVFSYIPNTAEVAFLGMTDGLRKESNDVRIEKVVWKDIKLRTFITEKGERNDLAAHVYDITYGSLRPYEDNLVVIDDSIVRGTTLKNSIIKILSRLRPKKLIIVSSAPQVRYPDFYGIDMSNMHDFIAFKAAVALLEERGMAEVIENVYRQCLAALQGEITLDTENYVKAIYSNFSDEEISQKICELVSANNPVPVQCIFQTLEGLHEACPNYTGDWYFSGNYPTPGGLRMLFRTFVDYYENFRIGQNLHLRLQ